MNLAILPLAITMNAGPQIMSALIFVTAPKLPERRTAITLHSLRFIELEDVKGKQVTIMVETTPVGFEEFSPKAQKVIDTVEWNGS
jgi:hypothetical protein